MKMLLRLVASANSHTIVELIGELFIGELLNYIFLDFQKSKGMFQWFQLNKLFKVILLLILLSILLRVR